MKIPLKFEMLFVVFVAALLVPCSDASTKIAADYANVRARMSGDFKSSVAECLVLPASTRDICVEQALAKDRLARAQLDETGAGNPAARKLVRVAEADLAYVVARKLCDDKAGQNRQLCLNSAAAARTRALLNAKTGRQPFRSPILHRRYHVRILHPPGKHRISSRLSASDTRYRAGRAERLHASTRSV